MSQKDKTITVKMTFNEDDLNRILDSANFGDADPLTVDQVIKDKRFSALKKALEDTNFVTEIVENSDDACANDWLDEWGGKEEEG